MNTQRFNAPLAQKIRLDHIVFDTPENANRARKSLKFAKNPPDWRTLLDALNIQDDRPDFIHEINETIQSININRQDTARTVTSTIWQKILELAESKADDHPLIQKEDSVYRLKKKEEILPDDIRSREILLSLYSALESYVSAEMRSSTVEDMMDQIHVEFNVPKTLTPDLSTQGADKFAQSLLDDPKNLDHNGQRIISYTRNDMTGAGTVRSRKGDQESMRKVAAISVAKGGTGPFSLFGDANAQAHLAQELMKYKVTINMDEPGIKFNGKTYGNLGMTQYQKMYQRVQAHNERIKNYHEAAKPRAFNLKTYQSLAGNPVHRSDFVRSLSQRDTALLAEDLITGGDVHQLEKLFIDIGGKSLSIPHPSWISFIGKGAEQQVESIIKNLRAEVEKPGERDENTVQIYQELSERFGVTKGKTYTADPNIPKRLRAVVRDAMGHAEQGAGARVIKPSELKPMESASAIARPGG